jgi:hypothetical protein
MSDDSEAQKALERYARREKEEREKERAKKPLYSKVKEA